MKQIKTETKKKAKMPPRRLQIVSSSSDEEDDVVSLQPPPPSRQETVDGIGEEDHITSTISLQSVTLNSSGSNSNSAPRNPNTIQPVPFTISDDDDDDDHAMPDVINVPSNTNHNQGNNASNSNPTSNVASGGAVGDILQRMGLRLRREWLESCLGGLERSMQGFSGFDDAKKAKLCFEQFLYSDMNYCGAGVLPENVHNLHLVDLKGPFVLQVDEIVNISCPLRSRYQKAAVGFKRCLKLSMTDGVQQVFAMEYRPIKDLEVLSPAGQKVVICNVNVRRGLLMLVPETIEVLGGKVEELDAARLRLVQEINKPPRGKRTRSGVVPSLSARATHAAWPPELVGVQEQANSSRMGVRDEQGTASDIPARDEAREPYAVRVPREDAEANQTCASEIDEIHMTAGVEQDARVMNREERAASCRGEDAEPNSLPNSVMEVEDFNVVNELEHPLLFTVAKASPFTYLASLSAKWAAMKDKVSKIQGKIKCFLTGVKGFQFKRRTTYELCVYVDDGSLISEILIHHDVVQKGIGHSPDEVSTALASSDARQVSDMKGTLKKFQVYLVNFEGTMLVEMTEASSVPVAIEMNQGCPASDAWLLFERVRSSSAAQLQQHHLSNTTNFSP